jgi:uncharacterized protein YdaU (DUF1376 family)
MSNEMTTDSWFPFYVGDFLADTTHLSPHDVGAYTLLLLWYYKNGPLPNNEDNLRIISRVERGDWVRTKGNVVDWFFKLNGDGKYHQKKADKVIAEREEMLTRRRHQTEAARAVNPKNSTTEPVTVSVTDRVTEPVTAVQPQPQPQPYKQTQTHPKVGGVSPSQKFSIDQRYEWLAKELCKAYGRPSQVLTNYEEQAMVAEIARRPQVKHELPTLLTFRAQSPRYFPQSITSLCRDWDKTLDRSRNHRDEKPEKELNAAERTLRALNRKMAEEK